MMQAVQAAPNLQTVVASRPGLLDYFSPGVIIGAGGTTILLLLGIIGWFVQREILGRDKEKNDLTKFEQKIAEDIAEVSDKFTVEIRAMADRSTLALEALNKAISQLAVALTEQRVWMAEHYVSKPDFKDELKVVHERVTRANIRIESIEECPRRDCPVKGDPRGTWPGGQLPGVNP